MGTTRRVEGRQVIPLPITATRRDMQIMAAPIIVQKDDRYGRLRIIEEVEPDKDRSGRRKRAFNCLCDCGETTTARLDHMRSGATTSCGCYHRELQVKNATSHGLCGEKAYHAYLGMCRRCRPSNPRRQHYFDKGISICREWSDPSAFVAWAKENGYQDGLQLDRINNDKGYSPDNCRFVSNKVNSQNRSTSYYWHIDNEVFESSTDAAAALNVPYSTIITWVDGIDGSGSRPNCYKVKKYPEAA